MYNSTYKDLHNQTLVHIGIIFFIELSLYYFLAGVKNDLENDQKIQDVSRKT